jgi:hypothetical protein
MFLASLFRKKNPFLCFDSGSSTHFSLGAGISTASYLYMACQPVMHGKRKARVVGGAVEFLCAGLSRSRVAWRSHKARESFSVGN